MIYHLIGIARVSAEPVPLHKKNQTYFVFVLFDVGKKFFPLRPVESFCGMVFVNHIAYLNSVDATVLSQHLFLIALGKAFLSLLISAYPDIRHYMPADAENIEPERKNIPKENLEQLAQKSYQLLDNFMIIPGVRSDNTIDNEVMDQWITQVRELALKADRIAAADSHIGTLLAYFPEEGTGLWPPDEISAAIERINTTSLKDSFAVAVINKRGSTGRGVFDGGTIEKNNAAYFQKLAGLHKYSHPSLSEIFIQISENYLNTAGHHDDQAERDRLEY